MLKGKKKSAMLPKSWKKSFKIGIITPKKMRFCNLCNIKRMCNGCNNQVNENKEFDGNINLLKRQAPNQFGHMLLYYKIYLSFFCTNSSIL